VEEVREAKIVPHLMVARKDLQAIFDIAVQGEGMFSGWWGTEEVVAARKIAVLLGVDPIIATPRNFARNYPHSFKATRAGHCEHCGLYVLDEVHEEEKR
jgi:hypothetical protein